MSMKRYVLAISLAGAMAADLASGQGFPTKPIHFFASEPGSASDISARIIGQYLSPILGQPVVVENRPGVLAAEAASKSAADGHNLLLYGSLVWLLPYMRDNVPWNVNDFAPITMTTSAPNLVVVNPASGINTIRDLIALAKSKPGQLNYSLGSRGASTHLAVELFKSMAGVNIVGVPYKGNVPGLTALITGEVHVVFPTAGSGGPFVKSGKLKAIAVTSLEPSALFPGVPTVAATGVPGFESVTILGVLGRTGTPDAINRRLNQEIVRIITKPDVKDKFFDTGAEVVGSSAEQFGAAIKSEMVRYSKVIKDAGIRAD